MSESNILLNKLQYVVELYYTLSIKVITYVHLQTPYTNTCSFQFFVYIL